MGEGMEDPRDPILIAMGGDGIELVRVDGRLWTLKIVYSMKPFFVERENGSNLCFSISPRERSVYSYPKGEQMNANKKESVENESGTSVVSNGGIGYQIVRGRGSCPVREKENDG